MAEEPSSVVAADGGGVGDVAAPADANSMAGSAVATVAATADAMTATTVECLAPTHSFPLMSQVSSLKLHFLAPERTGQGPNSTEEFWA